MATIDRLAITMVDGSQARGLLDALREAGFRATVIHAVGGFFHEAVVTLMVGLPQAELEAFFDLVARHCPRRRRYVPLGMHSPLLSAAPRMIEATIGGATIIVVPITRFVQL